MDFTPWIDPESTQSPGHQVIAQGGWDVRDAPLLLAQLQSGELPLDATDRVPGTGWSALDYVLLSCGSRTWFEQARPLAEWLVAKGQTPWEQKAADPGVSPRRGYELLAETQTCSAAMAWSWSLPDAPSDPLSPLFAQVSHDNLVARLCAGQEPMNRNLLQAIEGWQVDIHEPWSDGVRPLDLLLSHAHPGNRPLSRTVGQSARAPHEWVEVLRNVARVGKLLVEKNPRSEDVIHLRAVLWAQAHYASMRGNFSERPDWVGTLAQFDKVLGKAWGWKEKDAALHERLHQETLAWLVGVNRFDMARLAMEMSLMRFGEFAPQLFDSVSPNTKIKGLLDVAALVSPIVEELQLGVEPPGSPGWGWDPWRRAWRSVVSSLDNDDQDVHPSPWDDKRIWLLALPALALSDPNAPTAPSGSEWLNLAMTRGNLWPALDPWQATMETHGWSEGVRVQARARRLEERLASPSPTPSVLRTRF